MLKFLYFKKSLSFILILSLIFSVTFKCNFKIAYGNTDNLSVTSEAACLIEGNTGTVIYEKNKDKELIPASITKIMTLILIFEAIDSGKISLNDNVTVSEFAASMGGSQVFLEPGETQTVDTMIKCISIASANDACVAMAEHIAGTEAAFVEMMNKKAAELGMEHTHFMNCNGLDDTIESGHYSTAYDVALMSRELIMKHPEISNYSTVWMDTITHTNKKGESKEFGLTNTNKLIRTYEGITGLKTGSTAKAKYCLSATAKRDDLNLIAVVMAAPDHKTRFSLAASLLDYGFANCSIYKDENKDFSYTIEEIPGSLIKNIELYPEKDFSYIFTTEHDENLIHKEVIINENIKAPVISGDILGTIKYYYDKKEIGTINILAKNDAPKASYTDYLGALIKSYMFFKYSS